MCILLVAIGTIAGQSPSPTGKGSPPEYTFEVVRQFPHDPAAFTQGFTYHDGYFYEGTGQTGKSSLRQVNPETGQVVRKVDLAPDLFGEGVTVLGNEVFQLTWLSHLGFVYDLRDWAAGAVLPARGRSGVKRHRLRPRRKAAVCHGQAMAQGL